MGVDVGQVPSRTGESSQVAQAQAPHITDQDIVDNGSEYESEASEPEDLDDSND